MRLALVFSLVAALAGPALAQDQPASELPDIVVRGPAGREDEARRFIDAVSVKPVLAVGLATWRTPFCLQVLNLSPAVTGMLSSQIEARAANLGVEVQPPSCRANVTVVATPDGDETAAALVDIFPDSFEASKGPTQLDGRALDRFLTSDAAVRWWNLSAPYDTRNHRIIVPFANVPASWRRSLPADFFGEHEVRALLSAVVVVDARLTAEVPVEALGDYIAMVVLAEVDATTNYVAYPSILNMFTATPGLDGLTDWDLRYLNALYSAPVRSRNSRYQLSEIARMMAAAEAPQAANRPR